MTSRRAPPAGWRKLLRPILLAKLLRPIITAKPPSFRQVCNGLTKRPPKYGERSNRTQAQAGSRSRKDGSKGRKGGKFRQASRAVTSRRAPPAGRRKPPRPIVTAKKPPSFRQVCNGLTRAAIQYRKQRSRPPKAALAAALYQHSAEPRKAPAPEFRKWRIVTPQDFMPRQTKRRPEPERRYRLPLDPLKYEGKRIYNEVAGGRQKIKWWLLDPHYDEDFDL